MLVELVTVEAAYKVAHNVTYKVAYNAAHRMRNNVAYRMTNKRAALPPFFVGARFVAPCLSACLSQQAPALRPK